MLKTVNVGDLHSPILFRVVGRPNHLLKVLTFLRDFPGAVSEKGYLSLLALKRTSYPFLCSILP